MRDGCPALSNFNLFYLGYTAMTTAKVMVPSLDTTGFVTDPATMGAKLFMYAFTSEEWQSNQFQGSITSIPGIVIDNINSQTETITSVRSALKKQFDKHFEIVEISTSVKNEVDTRYTLVLNLKFGSTGDMHDLGTEVFIDSAKNEVKHFVDAFKSI